jgi:S-layer homology domain
MQVHLEVTFNTPRVGRPGRRRLFVSLLAAVVLAVPAAVFASHQFSDVPTTHTFHNNISALANAGVTGGCGGSNFCPDANVTRGQMAGFLNRGLGRMVEVEFNDTAFDDTGHVFGTVTISPSSTATGTQYVKGEMHGTIVFANDIGCPCTVTVTLRRGTTLLNTGVHFSVPPGGGFYPISVAGATEVTGSAPVTISVRAAITGHEGTTTPTTQWAIYGTLIAETFPFGSAVGVAP